MVFHCLFLTIIDNIYKRVSSILLRIMFPVRNILQELQILAISSLYSKTVKTSGIPSFLLISHLVTLSFQPRFHDISQLNFCLFLEISLSALVREVGPTFSTNIFDALKTKAINPFKWCGRGKSIINRIGKKRDICCPKNFTSLAENYISGLPYSFLPGGKNTIWEKLFFRKCSLINCSIIFFSSVFFRFLTRNYVIV